MERTHLQDLQILQAVKPERLAVVIEHCRRRGVALCVEYRDRLALHRYPGHQLELVLWWLALSPTSSVVRTLMAKPRTLSCCTVMCRSNRRSDRVSGDTTNTFTMPDMTVERQECDEREATARPGARQRRFWQWSGTYIVRHLFVYPKKGQHLLHNESSDRGLILAN